jgi:hypothetical protein
LTLKSLSFYGTVGNQGQETQGGGGRGGGSGGQGFVTLEWRELML